MAPRGADAGEACAERSETGDIGDTDRRVPLHPQIWRLLEICADLMADPQIRVKFGAQYETGTSASSGNGRLAFANGSAMLDNDRAHLPTRLDDTVQAWKRAKG